MQIIDGIAVFGPPAEDAVSQVKNGLRYATRAALMADHHFGYGVPNGSVLAFPDHVSPTAVGFDIACGNKAVRLDVRASKVASQIHKIMDEVAAKISFGLGRANEEPVEHPLFDDPLWQELPVLRAGKDKAIRQLGTVGSGNHYVDIFRDEDDQIWVGVHFGSRGLGHAIATEYAEIAKQKGYADDGIAVLHHRSDAGEEYIRAMELAGRYAAAGRDWVCERVAKILRGKIVEEVHNHHNFAWRETHGGEEFWVVRKGATPAFPGQRGFVGGSMAEPAVILEGVEHPDHAYTLYSTVHGAGRAMGRKAALGGRVTEAGMKKWLDRSGVVLRGGAVDEAPQVYKRLPEVLAEHAGSVKVVRTLTPLGVAMAPSGVKDPYKD